MPAISREMFSGLKNEAGPIIPLLALIIRAHRPACQARCAQCQHWAAAAKPRIGNVLIESQPTRRCAPFKSERLFLGSARSGRR